MGSKRSPPGFNKLLVALIVLVTLPSLAISSFGIKAIFDAREVAQARLKQSYEAKLRQVAHDLAVQLARQEATGEEEAEAAGEQAVELRVRRARDTLPQVVGATLDAEHIRVELVGERPAEPASAWSSERVRQAFREWLEGRGETAGETGPDVMAEVRLPPPLDRYRLQAKLTGADLVAAQARTTAALYGILLGMFYVLLILGVVLVSRSMYREVQLAKLKTDFVSHVSHELRTPLTSIRMFLETLMLGRVKDPKEQQECLQLCAQETERLSGMIERVLDWARIEAGRKQYQKRSVTAGVLVEQVLHSFGTQRLEAPYELTRDIRDANVELLVDADAVGDALLNILHNAFKYTGKDKRIHVSVVATRSHVDISVTDNGVGVPRSEHARIFERFYRAEDLLTQRAHGSGLGLALAKRMVEDQGGRILLHSAPGKGSTFTVRLPRPPARQREVGT